MLANTALLLAALSLGAPHRGAPIVPDAKPLEEPGRYQSPRTYEETLDYYKRVFKRTGGVRWRHIVNLPGIKAKHIQSLRRRTRWQGINIYEHRGQVRFYVIPRKPPEPEKQS